MSQELKEQLLAFLNNVESAMRSYNFALTARQYIDPHYHMKNIQKINNMSFEIKKRLHEND